MAVFEGIVSRYKINSLQCGIKVMELVQIFFLQLDNSLIILAMIITHSQNSNPWQKLWFTFSKKILAKKKYFTVYKGWSPSHGQISLVLF